MRALDRMRLSLTGRRWAGPMAAGGLALIVGTACLLEGWHARKRQDGGDRDTRDVSDRVEACEIQIDVVLDTIAEMCREAGVGHLADKAVLRLVRDASSRPVA